MLRVREFSIILMIVVAPILGACGSRVPEPDASTLIEDEGASELDPINRFLVSSTGYSIQQLNGATHDKFRGSVTSCMSESGYTLEPFEVASSETIAAVRPMTIPDLVPMAIDTVDSAQADASATEAPDQSAARSSHLEVCFEEARTASPDPAFEFINWVLTQAQAEIASVDSDPRAIEAATEYQACIRELGYSASDSDQLSSRLVDEVNAVVEGFFSGAATRDQTLRELRAMNEELSPTAPALQDCSDEQAAVRTALVSETLENFIDESGASLHDRLQELAPDIGKLKAQLALAE